MPSTDLVYEHAHVVRASLDDTFALFSDPANLVQLTPRWLRFTLADAPHTVRAGAQFRYRMAPLGLPVQWVAEISEWSPPHRFADVQLDGPYASWRHTHTLDASDDGTVVGDRIVYRLRGGRLGAVADRLGHRAFLDYLFAYRSRRIDALLGGHR